ncbi:Hypothetical predicted protein [Pelobates cultripes]|uniref:Uncharacterized protein n=1 Tax=Pelobates cultripes TaxID=61616 RepID=A0AAD1RLI7_PELCU|nr:Hypothetical predicted protein [Pelobates cultripes]
MQHPTDQERVTMPTGNLGVTPSGPLAPRPTLPQREEVGSVEQLNSEEFHSLLDATMAKSVTQAIFTAMGTISDNLTQSISHAIMVSGQGSGDQNPKAPNAEPAPLSGRKAPAKTHHMGTYTSKTVVTDRLRPVTDEDVGPPRKRASHRAKAVRSWKWVKANKDISDSDSDQKEVWSESEDMGLQNSEDSSPERDRSRQDG